MGSGVVKMVQDASIESPLLVACKNKNIERVSELLQNGADPNPAPWGPHLEFPLSVAVEDSNIELLKLLLKHDANTDVAGYEGNTPLHDAVGHDYYKVWRNSRENEAALRNATSIIDILLENGADINVVNDCGETPLSRAAEQQMLDVVGKMLQMNGVNPTAGTPRLRPLTALCRTNDTKLVDLLLKHGADPNGGATTSCHLAPDELPLSIAVLVGNSELVALLLKHGANPDVADVRGNTALHYAFLPHIRSSRKSHEGVASSTTKSVLDVLLEQNVDVNVSNECGETQLYAAAKHGMLDVVRKMLQVHRGNPNAGSPHSRPLAAACKREYTEL